MRNEQSQRRSKIQLAAFSAFVSGVRVFTGLGNRSVSSDGRSGDEKRERGKLRGRARYWTCEEVKLVSSGSDTKEEMHISHTSKSGRWYLGILSDSRDFVVGGSIRHDYIQASPGLHTSSW
jgi:hypothetical protein